MTGSVGVECKGIYSIDRARFLGLERKAFMSTCLKGQTPAQMTQQEKMKECNKEAGAKALKGEDRKKFMSECLSSDKKS